MASLNDAAAGEWSMCVWVTRMCDTARSAVARTRFCTCAGMSGPGSITATWSPAPTTKVAVPYSVYGPGLFATTRCTSGDRRSATP